MGWSAYFDDPVDWDDVDPSLDSLHDVPVTYLAFNPVTELLKIGFSSDLQQRIKQLSTICKAPIEILAYRKAPGRSLARRRGEARDYEKDMHRIFAAHRVAGEWFRPDASIYEWFGCVCV